jgi:hypothetical protein
MIKPVISDTESYCACNGVGYGSHGNSITEKQRGKGREIEKLIVVSLPQMKSN